MVSKRSPKRSRRSPTRPRSPRRRVSNRRPKRSRRSPKRSPRRYRSAADQAAANADVLSAQKQLDDAKARLKSLVSGGIRSIRPTTLEQRGHTWSRYTGRVDGMAELDDHSNSGIQKHVKDYKQLIVDKLKDTDSVFIPASELGEFFKLTTQATSDAANHVSGKQYFTVNWTCTTDKGTDKGLTKTTMEIFKRHFTSLPAETVAEIASAPSLLQPSPPESANASLSSSSSPELQGDSEFILSPELLATSTFVPVDGGKSLAQLFDDAVLGEDETATSANTILEGALSDPDQIRAMLDHEEKKRVEYFGRVGLKT